MSTREKVDALLADVLPKLEALKEDSLAAIKEAQEKAAAGVSRYREVAEELEGVEARLVMLKAEKESLPAEHSRAVLSDDVDAELRIKDRFAVVEREIEDLEDQASSLRAKKAELLPNDYGHPHDAMIFHHAGAAQVAYEERRALEELKARLGKALDGAVTPVVDKHRTLSAQVESWGTSRAWDPDFRERQQRRSAVVGR